MNVKSALLQRIFEKVYSSLASDKSFQAFIKENSEWLAPYAVSMFFPSLYLACTYL